MMQFAKEVKSSMNSNTKKKQSLAHWSNFQSVSWRTDAKKDFDNHTSVVIVPGSNWKDTFVRFNYHLMSWALPAVVGIVTACSAAIIEHGVEFLSGLRMGYCSGPSPRVAFFTKEKYCNGDGLQWIEYEHALAFYIGVSVVFGFTAALGVYFVAPMSRGSGVPEIKTILGGFVMAEALEFNTLVVKIFGLMLSVSSGMSLGKEGPLVHVGCCWANVLSRFSARYSENEAKRRELISTAAAAGVSSAFGAPLGGVLFSYEEVSTMFPQKTMIRAFFAASVSALTLLYLNPTGSGKLTMFQATYTQPPSVCEYVFFVFLGVFGGLIGALFIHLNAGVQVFRKKGGWWRSKVWEPLEVVMLIVITALTSYWLPYTKVLSSEAIHAFFYH
jgi:chloride channel 3/4/5